MKKIVLIGGGTLSHVRNHLSLAAPAYGTTVKTLDHILYVWKYNNGIADYWDGKYDGQATQIDKSYQHNDFTVEMILTKMANPTSKIVTNQDISDLVDKLIADKDVRVIVFNPALVDFNGHVGEVESGKHAERLRTDAGEQIMTLTPADKIIGRIRKKRKDIFVVGFKTTTNATSDEQYLRGLELLKKNSLNLVLANDTVTYNNMIIAPEETRYCETDNRQEVLTFLALMIVNRMQNKFTRSTVVDGDAIAWNGPQISETLRIVVNHCIQEGAYKPFLGKTAGHFAAKVSDTEIVTSIRKSNYNELDKVGMVLVESKNDDEVIAHGFKPSVGGQSQRIIFKEHPDMDAIVHFHCKPKAEALASLSIRPQWYNECGSHQCGKNTSDGLTKVDLGDGDYLKVVYLDQHGPNIVFNSKTNPQKIINYIDKTFDLHSKTGGTFQ
jgi:hypothetical protein